MFSVTNFWTFFQVVYTQSFPEKFLSGDYEVTGAILGSKMKNKGKFTLALCKYAVVVNLKFIDFFKCKYSRGLEKKIYQELIELVF